MSEGQVWFTIDRARYFLIPEDAPLREGSLRLRCLSGQGRGVDAGAARAFEISRDEATERLGAQIEGAYGSAREALLKLAAWAGQEGLASLSIPEHLSDFIDLPTGAIITDPERVRARVEAAIRGQEAPPADVPEADDFTDEALGEAPGEGEERGEGGPPPPAGEPPEELLRKAMREAGDKLRETLRSPEVAGALESLGDRLRRLARDLREEGRGGPQDNVVEFPGARRPPSDEEPEA